MPGTFDHVTFGSSGIRGPYRTLFTPELALALGRSIATIVEDVVVGWDARTTSPTLVHALTAGALSTGARVSHAGLVPTPTLAYAARGHDLGVMVTASHNPAQDNGLKLWEPDGSALGAKGREQVLAALRDAPRPVGWDRVGRGPTPVDALGAHREALLEAVGPMPASGKVVLDLGNGAACALTPGLLADLDLDVLTLNAQPDGRFPGRPSETTPGNLSDLSRAVAGSGAVCGLAHDGDGDRLVATDEHGTVLPGDVLLVLLARETGADHVVVPVDTSRLVWEALPDAEIEVTPVGDAHVSAALAASGAVEASGFGGEPSGAYIFPEVSLCPDGPHAALRIASMALAHGGLSDLVEALPTYETRRSSLEHGLQDMGDLMAAVADELEGWGQTTDLDGVRVETEDGWVLVRPSGTEPKVRVTAEARVAKVADRLLAETEDVVRACLQEVAA